MSSPQIQKVRLKLRSILTEENKKWGTPEDFKKWVTPEQIAEMILHLCSENGRAINGQIIQMYGRI